MMSENDQDERNSCVFESGKLIQATRKMSFQNYPSATNINSSGSRSSSVSLEEPSGDSPLEDILSNLERRKAILISQRTVLSNKRHIFIKELDQTETKIDQTSSKLHKAIDNDRIRLLSEIGNLRQETLFELDKADEEIQLAINSLEDYAKDYQKDIINGDANDLKDINMNIRQFPSPSKMQSELIKPQFSVSSVKFKRSDIPKGNIIGQVSMLDIDSSDPYVDTAIPVFSISGQETVAGITLMKRELFLLRELSSYLDVYSAYDGSPVRRIKLENLRKPSDIVSHPTLDQIFISDSTGFIYRLDTSDKLLKRWGVDGEPHGLYLCSSEEDPAVFSILVTCFDSRMMREYSSEGVALRNIRFTQDVANPWHSLPLPPSYDPARLLVCHGWESGKLHRVCHVDNRGKVCRTYGVGNGSGADKMDVPLRLQVDQFGYVFVADRNNDRVLLLSPNLVYIRDVVGRTQHRAKQPRRMCLDVGEGRLYVGYVDGSLVAYQITDNSPSTPLLTP